MPHRRAPAAAPAPVALPGGRLAGAGADARVAGPLADAGVSDVDAHDPRHAAGRRLLGSRVESVEGRRVRAVRLLVRG